MVKSLFVFFSFMFGVCAFSSEGFMFRIFFKDKGQSVYKQEHPEAFLSKRAMERRVRYNISIDSTDLPVSGYYVNIIQNEGCKVISESKWMNAISIFCLDSMLIGKIQKHDFVDSTLLVWKGDTIEQKKQRASFRVKLPVNSAETKFGYGYDQIKKVNGAILHDMGYKGSGMEIAIIDAGYKNLPEIPLLDNIIIKGVKDFVYEGIDVYESSDHGLKVLSLMGTNQENVYVGTAPKAKYWLLRSEDGRSEYPVEEDYWVAAAEYADSVGVDIINTSLGYSKYNAPAKAYSREQLDGKTAFITRAAEMAINKGIFISVSAGNEGWDLWRTITVPADAENVLTVGSVTRDSLVSAFSSRGPSADGRIKPDVVALGTNINVITGNGEIEPSSGTSFAGPVISGLAACLWEAFPALSNLQLLDIIKKSSHKYDNPDNAFGYGIPNMEKAMTLAKELLGDSSVQNDN